MLQISAVAEHAWKDHHSIRSEEATVVDTAKGPGELPLKEALRIHMDAEGVFAPRLWNTSTGTVGLRFPDAE